MELTIEVELLRKHVRGNLKNHIANYEKAMNGWRLKCLSLMEDWVSKLNQDPDKFAKDRYWRRSLPSPPEYHTDDYNNALTLLRFHSEKTIRLTEDKYESWVLDKWSWSGQFRSSVVEYVHGQIA